MEKETCIKTYVLLDDNGEHAGFVNVNLVGKYFVPITIELFEDNSKETEICNKRDFLNYKNEFVDEILDDYINIYFNFKSYHIALNNQN